MAQRATDTPSAPTLPSHTTSTDGSDRGAVAVATVLIAMAVATVVLFGLVTVAGDLVDHQRARSAADSAALAGVIGGRSAAAEMASANGAELVGWERRDVSNALGDGTEVVVVVVVGERRATARATNLP